MSRNTAVSIDEVLESILRGAAKTLGCNSANLVVFNEVRQEVRIQVGLILERQLELTSLEKVLGDAVSDLVFTFEQSADTELYRAFRERTVIEVSSLKEVARGAFPEEVLAQGDLLIGDRRFLNVPVLGASHCYGVIIFEKPGTHPFSAQQRELLIRYANRIGEIIENHTRSFRLADLTRPGPKSRVRRLFFDAQGRVIGQAPGNGFGHSDPEDAVKADRRSRPGGVEADDPLPEPFFSELSGRAKTLLQQSARAEGPRFVQWPPPDGPSGGAAEFEAEIEPFELLGQPCVVCDVRRTGQKADRSIQNHLLQIALDKSAPALLLDPEFRITSCNEATGSLLDYGPEELVGRDVGCLFQHEADIHTILNHQFLFVSDGHYEETTTVLKRDGTPLSAKLEAVMLADETDRVIGYLVLLRPLDTAADLTGAETGIPQLMRRERLATMGEIAAQLAHEIRNPILAIGATLESLQGEHSQNSADGQILGSLSNEVQRLDMILRDYLSLAARQNTSVGRVNLRLVVEEARDLLMGLAKIGGKRILTHLKDVEIYADFDGLKQVFFNLFINAMEATAPGGTVECRFELSDGNIAVHVEDSGPGLKADPEQCFSPFFTTKSNGTGLGLTVCRRILRAHSGTVTLENREQGGCRASVVMPRGGS